MKGDTGEIHIGSERELYKYINHGRAYLSHMCVFVEPPPKPKSKTLVFCLFQFWLPTTTSGMANPTNIANANPDPPTPADRVVPIHDWRTKKDQKADKMTKVQKWRAAG